MEENRKNYIFKLLIGMIVVIAVIILICLVCSKCAKKEDPGKYNEVFEANLERMLESAKNYYMDDRLPIHINDSKNMALQTMIDLDIIPSIKDSEEKECDTLKSYVVITKTSDDHYDLKAKLICSKKTDDKEIVISSKNQDTPITTKYTVTFNTDGGSSIDSQTIVFGEKVSKPSDPTKSGYTFAGWYLGNNSYNFDSEVLKDITLTAKWTKNNTDTPNPDTTKYTVKFNTDGGSSISSQTIIKGGKVSKPSNPTKTGYTFAGWYLGNNSYNFNTQVTKDITLTAKWTKNNTDTTKYTVTFNTDGGSSISSQTVIKGGKVSKPSNPTKTGYTFAGWYLGNNSYNFNNTVSSNITLTAKWTKNSTDAKQLYYEHVPVKKTYGNWSFDRPTSGFYETKTEDVPFYAYYKTFEKTYHSVYAFTKKEYDQFKDDKGKFTIQYTLVLNEFSATKHSLFVSSDPYLGDVPSSLDAYKGYKEHYNQITFLGNSSLNYSNIDADAMYRSNVDEKWYNPTISKPYVKDGKVLVDIKIILLASEIEKVTPYTGVATTEPLYFVEVPFHINSVITESRTVAPDFSYGGAPFTGRVGEYVETRNLTLYRSYRWDTDSSKAIWDTRAQIEGYQPTGRTKWA